MISSAGVAGARLRRPAASATTGQRPKPQRAATAATKRPREPCDDEVAHQRLTAQRDQLLRAVAGQADALADLERGILDFHYTHTICYNEDRPPALAGHPADTTTSSSRGSNSTGAVVDDGAGGSARTAYYLRSDASRLRAELLAAQRSYAAAEARETAKVAAVEAEVESTIVGGTLAEQRAVTAREEAAYEALVETLAEAQAQCRTLEKGIAEEEEKHADVMRDAKTCEERIAAMEEKKKRQMENAENTRHELHAAREAVKAAQKELRRREAVIRHLQDEIARRKERLKKRRVQK